MNLNRCVAMIWKFILSRLVNNIGSVIIVGGFIFVFLFWYVQPDKTLANVQKACIADWPRSMLEKETADGIEEADDISHVVTIAKMASQHNGTVLVSVVNDAYLPFAYSWLCNTKHMNIHKSVLVITMDGISKYKLNKDWPDVNVVKLNLDIPRGNQEYSSAGYLQIMIRRTEMLLELLKADIEVLLLEFDYMWFSNPLPNLQKMKGVDFLINPVTSDEVVYNGGFLYMFPTERSKALWSRVTEMMRDLGKQLEQKSDKYQVSEDDNDQIYFSTLVKEGFAEVKTQELPLHTYADGKWYDLPSWKRKHLPTVVISNNFVLGNQNKVKRAKKWNHWFLRDNCTCDFDLVRKTVHR
ncbi:uncharacterized protein LOC123554136 [Mercenaria mercenaria]|uniref:uncharacterized protein LOC123554136 n=1 Tax=Mercenaria mercenaria TaxID=6596 RepID=UPI00234F772E|nr:uncharacterized protein LOC123554136 [Mercenaria mercenaria]